jgi:hypothetical protein
VRFGWAWLLQRAWSDLEHGPNLGGELEIIVVIRLAARYGRAGGFPAACLCMRACIRA